MFAFGVELADKLNKYQIGFQILFLALINKNVYNSEELKPFLLSSLEKGLKIFFQEELLKNFNADVFVNGIKAATQFNDFTKANLIYDKALAAAENNPEMINIDVFAS